MNIIRFALTWCAAMGWHLYRIGTGRPAYKSMSDTPFMVFSFLGVAVLAALLRWAILHPASGDQSINIASAWQVGTALCIYFGGLYLCAGLGGNRSNSLFAALVGVSALMDLVASSLYLFGVRDTVLLGNWGIVVEIVFMLVASFRLHLEPNEIKQPGYRASKGSF